MNNDNLHNEDDQIKKEAPFLFGMKKEEPFQAPDGYFEKFQSELSDRIHSKKTAWWEVILRPVVWAPSLIIVLALVFFLIRPGVNNSEEISVAQINFNLDQIPFEAIDAYVNDHLLAQIDTDEIIDMVGIENISLRNKIMNAEAQTEIKPSIEHISDDDIEDYLMENLDELEIYL